MSPVLPLRILIPALLLLSAVLAGLGSFPHMSSDGDRHVEIESLKHIRMLTKQLQVSINIMLLNNNFEGASTLLALLATDNQANIALIVDDQGKVLMSARKQHLGKEADTLTPFLKNVELTRLFKLNEGDIKLSNDKNKIRAVYPLQLPVKNSKSQLKRSGLLVFENSIRQEKLIEHEIMKRYVKIFVIIVFCLSVMIWIMFHFLITLRVNRLVEVTSKLAKGDLSIRTELMGRDEFSCIGKALDVMANELFVQQYEQAVSEERLCKSQQFANMGSWDWNIKTGEVVWSDTIAPMLGFSVDNCQANYDMFINSVHPEDRVLVEQSVQSCLYKGIKYNVNHRIIKPDGCIRWMQETGDVERDKSGKPFRMLGMMRDITDQQEFNARLENTIGELNYQKYALDQHSIVAITDLKGVIVYANEKYSEISGYANNELLGSTHALVNSGFHSKYFIKKLWDTVGSGEIWQGEICNKSKNGDFYWMETTVVPHLDEDDKPDHYTVIRTDITERVFAQQAALKERSLLESINNIQSQFLHDSDPRTGFENLLQALLSATDSEYGFIGEVLLDANQKPYLKTMALTNIAWSEETRALDDKHAATEMESHNLNTLFGNVLVSGKPVISNDPDNEDGLVGLAKGHPELNTFLGVPLYMGDELIGVIGMANRPNGYDEKQLDHLQPLLTTCSRIIDSYKREKSRKQIEVDLTRFKSTLDKVQDSVFMFEPDSLIFMYVNQGAIEQVGYSQKELMKMSPLDIKPNIDKKSFYKMIGPL
ncbi:MAG: PAS domain-containing protein, partial [Thiotrichaceae bacterium]|nr:PAS domain-containing protein [Thiotrichaceae bacterium]